MGAPHPQSRSLPTVWSQAPMTRRPEGSKPAGSDTSLTPVEMVMRDLAAAILLVVACLGWGVLFLALSIP